MKFPNEIMRYIMKIKWNNYRRYSVGNLYISIVNRAIDKRNISIRHTCNCVFNRDYEGCGSFFTQNDFEGFKFFYIYNNVNKTLIYADLF